MWLSSAAVLRQDTDSLEHVCLALLDCSVKKTAKRFKAQTNLPILYSREPRIEIKNKVSGAFLRFLWFRHGSGPGLSEHIKVVLGRWRLTGGERAQGTAHTVCTHVCRGETHMDFKLQCFHTELRVWFSFKRRSDLGWTSTFIRRRKPFNFISKRVICNDLGLKSAGWAILSHL